MWINPNSMGLVHIRFVYTNFTQKRHKISDGSLILHGIHADVSASRVAKFPLLEQDAFRMELVWKLRVFRTEIHCGNGAQHCLLIDWVHIWRYTPPSSSLLYNSSSISTGHFHCVVTSLPFSVSSSREKLWICMEYCGGGSLQDIYHGKAPSYNIRTPYIHVISVASQYNSPEINTCLPTISQCQNWRPSSKPKYDPQRLMSCRWRPPTVQQLYWTAGSGIGNHLVW